MDVRSWTEPLVNGFGGLQFLCAEKVPPKSDLRSFPRHSVVLCARIHTQLCINRHQLSELTAECTALGYLGTEIRFFGDFHPPKISFTLLSSCNCPKSLPHNMMAHKASTHF